MTEAKGQNRDGDRIRKEIKSDDFVGKKKESHKIVGLGPIGLWINSKLFYAVRHNPLCGSQESGRLGHISTGVFEGVDDQLLFKVFHRFFKRERRDSARLLSGLKGRREMIAVNDSVNAEKDSPLNTILEFSYVAWPMVLDEHVNGWS